MNKFLLKTLGVFLTLSTVFVFSNNEERLSPLEIVELLISKAEKNDEDELELIDEGEALDSDKVVRQKNKEEEFKAFMKTLEVVQKEGGLSNLEIVELLIRNAEKNNEDLDYDNALLNAVKNDKGEVELNDEDEGLDDLPSAK